MGVARRKITGSYFAQSAASKGLPFVSTGCKLLDCALGGGFVGGRVANNVGDKSTGKSLLGIEVTANFVRTYPDGLARYGEAEAAWDDAYAEAIGFPVKRVQRPEPGTLETVEDFFMDVEKTLEKAKDHPSLYIIDSLDALTSKAEQGREIGQATYGQEKAKLMSEGFRKLVRSIEQSKMLLVVVSQVRDKIGVTFGETKTRSGGKALDFYASQIVWLADLGKIKRTVAGIERSVGRKLRANVKKNKVGLSDRMVDYPIIYGYGIDDIQAGLEWLLDVCGKDGHPLLDELRITKSGVTAASQRIRDNGAKEANLIRQRLNKAVEDRWVEIEESFLPKGTKYE
jgi:recombination protein RecA